jgi:hypothetical protein
MTENEMNGLFDINKEKIIKNCNPFEFELIKFLEADEKHSLQRFLLTRTDEELSELSKVWYEIVEGRDSDEADPSLIPAIMLTHKGYEQLSQDSLTETMNEVTAAISLIDMVKKGLLTYEMADDDADWVFNMPDDVRTDLLDMGYGNKDEE